MAAAVPGEQARSCPACAAMHNAAMPHGCLQGHQQCAWVRAYTCSDLCTRVQPPPRVQKHAPTTKPNHHCLIAAAPCNPSRPQPPSIVPTASECRPARFAPGQQVGRPTCCWLPCSGCTFARGAWAGAGEAQIDMTRSGCQPPGFLHAPPVLLLPRRPRAIPASDRVAGASREARRPPGTRRSITPAAVTTACLQFERRSTPST